MANLPNREIRENVQKGDFQIGTPSCKIEARRQAKNETVITSTRGANLCMGWVFVMKKSKKKRCRFKKKCISHLHFHKFFDSLLLAISTDNNAK